MRKSSIGIIVVNFNAGILLKNCIESVIKKSDGLDYKLIVIDNNSNDDSLSGIDNDGIIILKNKTNVGFAKACNQGLKYAQDCDYILLLNPDVEVYPNTLSDSLNYMDVNEHIGVLGVCHLDEKKNIKPSCSRFSTPIRLFNDIVGLSKLFPKYFNSSSLMTNWNHKTSKEVEQVMGAFLLTRKSIIDVIGLMDERFFVYYEDMDFCKRAVENGYKVFYNYEIKIFHKGMGTTESIKDIRLAYSLRSRLLYFRKHYSMVIYFYVYILSVFIEPFTRSLLLLLSNRKQEIKDVVKGYKIFFNGL